MAFFPWGASAEAKKMTDYHELPGKAKCSADRALFFSLMTENHSDLFSFEPRDGTLNGSVSLAGAPQKMGMTEPLVVYHDNICFCWARPPGIDVDGSAGPMPEEDLTAYALPDQPALRCRKENVLFLLEKPQALEGMLCPELKSSHFWFTRNETEK